MILFVLSCRRSYMYIIYFISYFFFSYLGQEGLVPLKSARLFSDLSEKIRKVLESYFVLESPLYFSSSNLVCRSAIGKLTCLEKYMLIFASWTQTYLVLKQACVGLFHTRETRRAHRLSAYLRAQQLYQRAVSVQRSRLQVCCLRNQWSIMVM